MVKQGVGSLWQTPNTAVPLQHDRKEAEYSWLSLNGLLDHGNGGITGWRFSGWLGLIRALPETL